MRYWLSICLCILGLSGCGKGGDDGDQRKTIPPATTQMTIDTMSGSYTSQAHFPFGGVLGVAFPNALPATYTLTFSGRQNGVQWSAEVDGSILAEGRGTVPVGDRLANDQTGVQTGAIITLGKPQTIPTLVSHTGSFEFTLVAGVLSGQVTTDIESLNARFHGNINVQCSVPPEDLPPDPNGGAPGGMASDLNFATPKCQPLARLRAPAADAGTQ